MKYMVSFRTFFVISCIIASTSNIINSILENIKNSEAFTLKKYKEELVKNNIIKYFEKNNSHKKKSE